ncbi:alpha/beta hydrolase [Sphingobium sp.]|uniref:alpha/beta fold hydrolase n=1 Tax=Sphingobium sp. TaxID=1912891 RepID=UPI0028BE719B|nr:alpha/beta hydrolase [Sphingobium sp.]
MIRKAYVDTGDGQLHYRYTSGGSGLPIVLMHLNGSTSEAYEAVMRELDGTVPTFAFDSPNNGESFRTDKTPSIGYMAQVILEAMSNLGVPRFHALGHHTGAHIALELACSAPQAVASAVLSGTSGVTPEEGQNYIKAMAIPNPPTIYGTQIMTAWTRTLVLEQQVIPGLEEWRHRECLAMLKAGNYFRWGYQAVFTDTMEEKLNRVTRPVFFIVGRRDPVWPEHNREVERHPEFPSHVAEHCGLFYADEDPADFARHVLEFIRQHDA